MATEVNGSGATLTRGNPTLLFKIRLTAASGPAGLWHPYSVSADGQRILAIVNLDDPTASPLTVVLDWVAAAKR